MGLGYVGCVSAACFARNGHYVIGVDVKNEKIHAIQQGKSPIIEPELANLVSQTTKSGHLTATQDLSEAVKHAEIIMICVGTTSRKNGSLDLSYVERVCTDIGKALAKTDRYLLVIIRSTLLPGSATTNLIPLLESASGKKAGKGFGFCVNPEFLREGSAIADFDNPPYTIIGQLDELSGAKASELYTDLNAPLHIVPLGEAEMVKYASNSFHALKVTFANEIGNLCKAFGVDSHRVMDIFVQDTKLNLSPYYMKPGFAFGGSCLPKDLRALLFAARQKDIQVPVLESILPSNDQQVAKALEMLIAQDKRKVGLIGLSFKPNTDDLRESPAIELAERLIGKGFDLYIYDHEVSLSQLHGSNREYIEKVMPHISSLMQPNLEETVNNAETIVIAKKPSQSEYELLIQLIKPEQIIIDLVRLNGTNNPSFGSYYGICW